MTFRTAAILQDTCAAHAGDTPTKNVGCRFVGQSEEATSSIVNRASLALAENDEHLLANMQHKAMLVCDATPATVEADYAGPTALQDALTAVTDDVLIFLRPGTYVLPAGASYTVAGVNVSIYGAGSDDSIAGSVVEVPNGFDFIVTGDRFTLEGVRVKGTAPTDGMDVHFNNCRGARVQDCVFEDMALICDAQDSHFSNIVCGGRQRAIHVGTNTERCVIQNVEFAESAGVIGAGVPLIKIDGADELEMSNIDYISGVAHQIGLIIGPTACRGVRIDGMSMVTGDADAFRFDGATDHTNIDVTNSSFDCDDGVAWSIVAATSLKRASFRNCEFRAERTLFDSNADASGQKYLDLAFDHCSFVNMASSWHPYRIGRMLAIRGWGADFTGACTMDDCYIFDVWAQGDTAAGIPGVGVGGTALNLVDLEAVDGRNLVMYRGGIAFGVEDGTWIRFTDSRFDGVDVQLGVGAFSSGTYLYNAGVPGDGLISVLAASCVKNLRVGQVMEGAWHKPVLYVLGGGHGAALDTPEVTSQRAVVDGFTIVNIGSADWQIVALDYAPLWAKLDGNATLRRFVWQRGNRMADYNAAAGVTQVLVKLENAANIFEDFQIAIDTTNATAHDGGSFESLIKLESGLQNIVRNGKVYILPDEVNDLPKHVVEQFAGDCCEISNIIMVYDGNLTAVGQRPIEVWADHFHRVNGNVVNVTGQAAAAGHVLIFFSAGLPAYCTVLGNCLNAMAGGSTPDITAGVIGYALNVMTNAAVGPTA